jgi:hypothetical protein
MPLDHTGVHLLVAQEGQHVFEPGFAMENSHVYSLDPTPLILFFHLAIGQSVRPAQDGTRGPACGAMAGGRITTSKGL